MTKDDKKAMEVVVLDALKNGNRKFGELWESLYSKRDSMMRPLDACLQRLKKRGLVKFAGQSVGWCLTDKGEEPAQS